MKEPFDCEYCDYGCGQKSNLRHHVAKVNEVKKPFKCKYCDFCCTQKGNLIYHYSLIHEGKKPIKSEASSSVKSGKTLKNHMGSVYEGKKPFNCSQARLKALTANIRGIECYGRLEQVRILLVKHQVQ